MLFGGGQTDRWTDGPTDRQTRNQKCSEMSETRFATKKIEIGEQKIFSS